MAARKTGSEPVSIQEANERDLNALDEAINSDDDDSDDEEEESEDDDEGEEPEESEDDDSDEESGEDDEEERPTRRQKRRSRYDEVMEANAQLRERLAVLEAGQQQPAQGQETGQDDLQTFEQQANTRIAAINERLTGLQQFVAARNAAKQPLTQEEANKILDDERELLQLRQDTMYQVSQRRFQAQQPRQPPPAIQHLKNVYADVDTSEVGSAYTRAYFLREVKKGRLKDGKTTEINLLEEAYRYGRAEMKGQPFTRGTAQRPKPTANTRAKFTGTSANAAPGGRAGKPSSGRITLSDEEARMADAWGKNVKGMEDPNKRYLAYYKNVIKPMREREAKGRDGRERRRA